MDHHTRRLGANVLLVRNGKILLPRRKNTKWASNTLGIPGGHLEEGETARQAAVREIEEELGLKLNQDRLIYFATAHVRTNHEYVNFEFYVDLNDDEEPVNNEPEHCSELVWCDSKSLPEDVHDVFKTIIERAFNDGELYLEIGY